MVLPIRPTYRLDRLDMSEIILKGTLNGIKKQLSYRKTGVYRGIRGGIKSLCTNVITDFNGIRYHIKTFVIC